MDSNFDESLVNMMMPFQVNVVPSGHIHFFESGQFADQYIRIELQELQKADVGRKYATVDRRPLDPPPVVLLRLFHVYNYGTIEQFEEEVDYENINTVGIVCTVDLFPVPEEVWKVTSSTSPTPGPFTFGDGSNFGTTLLSYSPTLASAPPVPSEGIFDHTWNYPVVASEQTKNVVGEKVSEAYHVEYRDSKGLIFVFGDLAVRREGTFILRYRVFDISLLRVPGMTSPTLTETYGGPFKVYSTKEFPGLSASTDLTKYLARYSIRLAVRQSKRVSMKRSLAAQDYDFSLERARKRPKKTE